MIQAGAAMLALWSIAMALFLDLKIQGRSTVSLQQLDTTLSLNSQIHTTLDQVNATFWHAYYSQGADLQAQYAQEVSRLQGLTARYSGLELPADEQDSVELLGKQEGHLLEITNALMAGPRTYTNEEAKIHEVQRLHSLILNTLQRTVESELQQLKSSTVEMDEYTRALLVLLLGCALFTAITMSAFRYVHRHHLWGPLEELRRMVLTVRRGNLDVTGEIPASVEFGTLMQTFLDMAGELREMRHSLEQKVIERTAKLDEAQQELLQAAKLSSLGQLVSGVAHEINNPLTSILGFSELLLARPELAPSLRTHVQTIREESMRSKNVAANLSSFARRAPQRTQRMDLRATLDRLVDLRQYQLTANNVRLQYDRPALAVNVDGDPDQLLQVLVNLVVNAEQAIKTHRETGSIWLGCGVEGAYAWVRVEDDGEEMTAAVRKHLFEPFLTARPVGHGTGFGLSISHGIIEQHRGKLTIESVAGQGTIARITLPRTPFEEPAPASFEASSERARANGHLPSCVLIVDDEPAIGEMIEEALVRRGCQATFLQDSNGFASCIAAKNFDFVICDMKMPGSNGLEILRRLRESRPELVRRFLLMTGNLADAEAGEIGFADVAVLRKPFTLNQLLEAIRGAMHVTN